MKCYFKWLIFFSWMSGALLPAVSHAGPKLTVRDVKGRALEIELIAADAKTVNFRRTDSPVEFSLAMDTLDAASQTEILKEAVGLTVVFPKIDAEVVIGKRRDKGDSWYMVEQQISCTVKLHNTSLTAAVPKITGKVFFFGRSQRNPDNYIVLNIGEFPVELKVGGNSSTVLEPFATMYDSDNKGYGNVGGYQYSGHLLLLIDDQAGIVLSQSTDPSIRKAITENPKLLSQILTYQKDVCINENLVIQKDKIRESRFRGD